MLENTVCMQLSGFVLTAEGLLVGAQVGLNEDVIDDRTEGFADGR